MDKNRQPRRRGIRLRRINGILATLTIGISILLLFFAYRTTVRFRTMRTLTFNYIEWQRSAHELQAASDYLTEQVRCFSVTGDVAYLWHYFEEAEVSRRRDKTLDILRPHLSGTAAYEALETAMEESVELMETEYDSMRLVIDAKSYDLTKLPEALRDRELPEKWAILDPDAKMELARTLVFDEVYHGQKEAISFYMQVCLDDLVSTTEALLYTETDNFRILLRLEQLLILVMILLVLAILLLTTVLVIRPLFQTVDRIRAEQPIATDSGSEEFRFLARTYNQIFEANRARREKLVFDAAHDKLTSLYNRSGYDVLMAKTDWSSSALLVLDVDLFKNVNDSFGHEMGDRVLAWVAAVLRDNFRSEDYVCRIGGDEFTVIMQRAKKEHKDLIRQKVDAINAILNAPPEGVVPVSISVGVAFGALGSSSEEVFNAADAALYRVKNSGRSSCAFAE